MKFSLAIATILFTVVGTAVALTCPDKRKMPFEGKCQEINCRNDATCKKFTEYCKGRGQPICRGISGICGCQGESVIAPTKRSCNKHLNGNDHCNPGQVCLESGLCVADPKCSFHGEECSKRSCCSSALAGSQLFCHQRKGSALSCVNEAFVAESCDGGIPCEQGSVCLPGRNICSKRPGDGCDDREDICSPGASCRHVPISEGVNKECLTG